MVGKQNNHSLLQNYEESEEGNQTLRDLVEIAILEMQMTDVGVVLSKGIYKVYANDNSIKQKFEESLLQMLDHSDFDVYLVCLYLISQLFKEKNGLSPFELSKNLIIEKLTTRLNERKKDIKSGIEYPNGYINTNAMEEIQRFRMVCKEEYRVLF